MLYSTAESSTAGSVQYCPVLGGRAIVERRSGGAEKKIDHLIGNFGSKASCGVVGNHIEEEK